MPALRVVRLHALVVVALTLLVGALRFANDFVYDDIQLLVQSDFVYDWSNAPRLFLNNTMFAADGGEYAETAVVDTYRPLTMLTFFVDGALGRGAPWAFHLSNQLGHLLVVLLLWSGLRRQQPDAPLGAVTLVALGVAMHPLLAEAQVWINGRSDIWAAVFALLAYRLWPLDGRTDAARGAAIAAALFAGMLCKEVVLFTVPALVVACGLRAWQRGDSGPRAALASGVGPAVAIAAYLGARSLALGGMKAGAGTIDIAAAAMRVPLLWWDGLATFVAPRTLMMRHLAEDYAAPSAALLALAAAGALLLGAAAIRYARQAPGALVGLGWYAATLAPAVLIAFTPGWVGFGRYLYLPSIGLVIAVVAIVASAQRGRGELPRLLPLVGGVWVLAMALLCVIVTLNYRSNLSFYAAIADEQPERAHGHRGVSESLHALGQYEEAAAAATRAVELDPRLRTPHVTRTMSLLQSGHPAEAEQAALAGLELHATSANLWQLLSLARLEIGRGDAVSPLLNAYRLAGAAPWLDAYLQHLARSQTPTWLDEAQTAARADGLAPLADRIASLRPPPSRIAPVEGTD